MFVRIRPLLIGALMLIPGVSLAQSETVKLASALRNPAVTRAESFEAYAGPLAQRRRRAAAATTPISLRVGAALGDDSGLLIGLDLGLPAVSIGAGWSGRLDLDIWGFGGDDTNVGVILNQISSADGQTYFGFGLGVVAGGDSALGVKLLLGTTLSERVDLEFDIILHDDVTPAILARIHL